MKKIVLLGAGLVARPAVKYLLQVEDIELHVADIERSKATALVGKHPRGIAHALDVNDPKGVEKIIEGSVVVISLLPYTFHVAIAKECLKGKINLITASYVSDDMRELHDKAAKKGLLFLNEMGADPGIDHMSAMRVIHQVKEKGGKITSFESVCGGLPAPDANNNPLGYKISWSPRAIVMAGRNSAQYLRNGSIVNIAGTELFHHKWIKSIESLGDMEIYANRDSLIYKTLYELDKAATVFRGTIRNQGWCSFMTFIEKLGYLNNVENQDLKRLSCRRFTGILCGASPAQNVRQKCAEFLGVSVHSEIIDQFEWLGLFSDIPLNDLIYTTPMDVIAKLMTLKMQYQSSERDMLVMQHDFIAEYPDGKREAITSLLIDYGVPGGDTSMARTVSLPAAIVAKMIADGKIKGITGVTIPTHREIYGPVLEELKNLKINFKETIRPID